MQQRNTHTFTRVRARRVTAVPPSMTSTLNSANDVTIARDTLLHNNTPLILPSPWERKNKQEKNNFFFKKVTIWLFLGKQQTQFIAVNYFKA